MSKEIALTKGKFAIVDDDDYEYLMRWKWLYSTGYAKRHIRINKKPTFIPMTDYILDVPEGMIVDHINRNSLDNRKSNLRICTHAQNIVNRGVMPTNTSGKKGVSWDRVNKKWRAVIKSNYKFIHIGRYNSLEDASNAYIQKAKELFGEFACED